MHLSQTKKIPLILGSQERIKPLTLDLKLSIVFGSDKSFLLHYLNSCYLIQIELLSMTFLLLSIGKIPCWRETMLSLQLVMKYSLKADILRLLISLVGYKNHAVPNINTAYITRLSRRHGHIDL